MRHVELNEFKFLHDFSLPDVPLFFNSKVVQEWLLLSGEHRTFHFFYKLLSRKSWLEGDWV